MVILFVCVCLFVCFILLLLLGSVRPSCVVVIVVAVIVGAMKSTESVPFVAHAAVHYHD